VTHPFFPEMGSLMVRSEWEAFNEQTLVSGSGDQKSGLTYE